MSTVRPTELLRPERDGEAEVGERVTVLDLETTAVHDYRLLDGAAAHAAEGEVSIESALGAALLGRHVGDVVSVESDGLTISLEIVEIDG
jgi:transcription elongation factor GreA